MFQVIVRLGGGDEEDAGVFDTRDAADKRVAELTADADAERWLALGDRTIRSSVVVSIDVHEGRAPRWKGSESRQRWAEET
jgi:hypothetical protein